MIKREINILLSAIMFYTILPVGRNIRFSEEVMSQTTRYYPLTGILVGAIGAATFWLSHMVLPFQMAVVLSMVATTFVTGAFHEDSIADFCDGFGGGYTKEGILEIMKDSRIGTFGATGLFFILTMKFVAISNMEASSIPAVLLCAHAFSRVLPVIVINTSEYVRKDDTSKIKSIAHKGSKISMLIALLFGTICLALLPLETTVIIMVLSGLLFVIFAAYMKRKIGGYTGDVLGALQQLAEVIFYIGFLIQWK